MAAIAGNISSILVFFWFVQEVGLGLRPVSVLQHIFGNGKIALDSVYERSVRSVAGAGTMARPAARRRKAGS